MEDITYYTDFMIKMTRICRKKSKYALDKLFMAIFSLAERLPTIETNTIEIGVTGKTREKRDKTKKEEGILAMF